MEKHDKDSHGSDSEDSSKFEVAEEMEVESQQQDDPDEQMRDEQIAEVRNETSEDLSGGTNDESGEISQPKVGLCKESMPDVLEGLAGSTGMESEAVAGECQKQSPIQASVQMAGDATADEASEQSKEIDYTGGKLINDFYDAVLPAKPTESSNVTQKAAGIESNDEIPERIEEQQNVPVAEGNLGAGPGLKHGEQPEQELQVQETEQVIEFVIEEAVIETRQEQMEEAEDIVEPQKYAFREKHND